MLFRSIELSSGVWSLAGEGALTGRISMAAFMLGWAGVSVHCQVLSFIGDSGLSVGTYLVGKFLHGGLSALFAAGLARVVALEAPVADYLAEQVDSIAALDFHTALTISIVCAWVLFLLFLLAAAAALGKGGGKKRKNVV